MWSKEFWRDLAERCLYTFAESLLGYVTVAATIAEVDWVPALSTAGVATLVAALKCIIVGLAKNNE